MTVGLVLQLVMNSTLLVRRLKSYACFEDGWNVKSPDSDRNPQKLRLLLSVFSVVSFHTRTAWSHFTILNRKIIKRHVCSRPQRRDAADVWQHSPLCRTARCRVDLGVWSRGTARHLLKTPHTRQLFISPQRPEQEDLRGSTERVSYAHHMIKRYYYNNNNCFCKWN